MLIYFPFVFFFTQNTAYELRISDWISDVCSTDLPYLNCASTCGAFEQVQFDVVNVDLHSARPGRGHIPCRLTDANIDKPSLSAIASHLLAEEFRAGGEAHREVERKIGRASCK